MRSSVSVSILLFPGILVGQVDTIYSGMPETFQYCAPSDLDTMIHFFHDGVASLTLEFCAGQWGSATWDHLQIYDGPDELSTVLWSNDGMFFTQDLSDVLIIATGPEISMEMRTDEPGDCQEMGFTPLLWSVSADGIAPCVLGLNDQQAVDGLVYPHPADGEIHIRLGSMTGNERIGLRDGTGRLVPVQAYRSGAEWCVNTSDLASGEYYVTMVGIGRAFTSKVTILH